MLLAGFRRKLATTVTAATMLSLFAALAHALCEHFDFRLSADQVVPTVDGQGFGWSEMQLCADDTLRGYITINVAGMVTAVHIHGPAPAGENGALLYELSLPDEHGHLEIVLHVREEQKPWFTTYRAYVDVHTGNHPDGAIRGQMIDRGTALARKPWHAVKRLFR